LAPEAYYVVGADANPYHLEWGDLDAAYQAPLTTDPGYLEFLNCLCESEGIDFLHGQPDWEVSFLSSHRSAIRAATFLPDQRLIRRAQNKYTSACLWYHAALREDVPILLHDGEDLRRAAASLGVPFWLRATSGAGARGSCKVLNLDQARAWLDYWRLSGAQWDFMAQTYLSGREYAFQSLWYEGRLVTSAARERLEFVFPQHAPSGVTSSPVVARSVHDPEVNRVATGAILALDRRPHGVYGVDLKCGAAGQPHPTEVNAGRFFTTSLFLAEAGCNLPHYYVCLGLGRSLPELPRYDAIPPHLYWIRHIDCGQVLVREGAWRARPSAQSLRTSWVPAA
jgi:carbamoyl-phosphate synthase large subunit